MLATHKEWHWFIWVFSFPLNRTVICRALHRHCSYSFCTNRKSNQWGYKFHDHNRWWKLVWLRLEKIRKLVQPCWRMCYWWVESSLVDSQLNRQKQNLVIYKSSTNKKSSIFGRPRPQHFLTTSKFWWTRSGTKFIQRLAESSRRSWKMVLPSKPNSVILTHCK